MKNNERINQISMNEKSKECIKKIQLCKKKIIIKAVKILY